MLTALCRGIMETPNIEIYGDIEMLPREGTITLEV